MRRREFIAVLGGVVAAPLRRVTRSSAPSKIPRIGIIDDGPIWTAVPRCAARSRLHRRPDHRLRVSPRRWRSAAARGRGGRARRAARRRDRHLRHAGEPRRQDRDLDDPDRRDLDRRSGARRPRAKPGASRRQHHRQHHSFARSRTEAAAARQGDHSIGHARGAALESGQRLQRRGPRTVADRRAGARLGVHRGRGAQRRRARQRIRHPGARTAGCGAADQRSGAPQPHPADHRFPDAATACRECFRPAATPRPAA